MKKYKIVLIVIMVLLSGLGVGCGIPQEQYDRLGAQLRDAQAQVSQLQGEITELQKQNGAADTELKNSLDQVAQLQGQISGLKDQYELVGKTPAETAGNIVRLYHETHVYSAYDLFVCGDMAAEVWNMLKAQGIKSILVVGNKDMAIDDILNSNHAWVLAEIAPGEYLALETTAGRVVQKS